MAETATPPPATVAVLGIPFHNVTFQEAVQWVRARILSRQPAYIATVNMDFVMQAWRDPELQRILIEADLVVADGIPIVWLSGLLGPRLKERVTGSDLVPMLAELVRDHGFSLFHLGGTPGVAEKAAATLVRRFPGLRIAGCYSPPYADVLHMNHADILERLRKANPDLVLVAFGSPKQEKFAKMHGRHWGVPVAIGVGGSLDFLAGAQKRAPKIVQRLALEWLWRMASDPPRLFRRYMGNLAFFGRTLLQLLWVRCRPDRAEAPVSVDSAVRRAAHVEPCIRLACASHAETFCASVLEKAAGRPVVLDMSGVPWLSSLELGALLRLATRLRRQGQHCILSGAGRRVRRLLAWCHLTEYLEAGNSDKAILERIREWEPAFRDGGIRLDPDGRVQITLPLELTEANLDSFRRTVEACPDRESVREWVLQASSTSFVDSSALEYFLLLKKQAVARGTTLRFAGVRPSVRWIFRLAKVESVLLEPEAR